MKPQFLVILAILALTGLAMLYDNYNPAPPQAAPTEVTAPIAPDFAFTPPGGGKTRQLYGFKGKFILLNFWASWCLPCKQEFPELLALAAAHPDKLVLIAISADEDEKNAISFMQTLSKTKDSSNIHFGWDKGKTITQDVFHTLRYPETIILGPDLAMKRKIAGPVRQADMAEILKLLAEMPRP